MRSGREILGSNGDQINAVVNVENWKEYQSVIDELYRLTEVEIGDLNIIEQPIFRGANSDVYDLCSTLDRLDIGRLHKRRFLEDYHYFAKTSLEEINSYDNTGFSLGDNHPFVFHSNNLILDPEETKKGIASYIYLRHHGFPSPIVDWTKSPYIALYFAYKGYKKAHGNPVVYVLNDARGGRLYSESSRLFRLPYWGFTHRRHYMQQCEYTIVFDGVDENLKFGSYGGVNKDRVRLRHNTMIKIVLPGSDKKEIMRELYKMNINDYTLFMSNDSLVTMVAERFLLRQELANDFFENSRPAAQE